MNTEKLQISIWPVFCLPGLYFQFDPMKPTSNKFLAKRNTTFISVLPTQQVEGKKIYHYDVEWEPQLPKSKILLSKPGYDLKDNADIYEWDTEQSSRGILNFEVT